MDETVDVRKRRNNRARKMLFFTPSYNVAVVNKIGKAFFRLINKKFSPSRRLNKYFTRTLLYIDIFICPMGEI